MKPLPHPAHPARYNKAFLPVFARMIRDKKFIFDPLAGTGERLLELKEKYLPDTVFIGTEIEKEWADITPSIVINMDVFKYLRFTSLRFDGILTSPVFGNRMSDHHNAKDASKRNTYTHRLGRPLSENNSGKLHWGKDEYAQFHVYLWKECVRVLKQNGIFILNIKNHYKKGIIQNVTEWHEDILLSSGLKKVEHIKIETPSLKFGQNSELRIPYESIILFAK